MFLMFRILRLVDNGRFLLDQVQYVVMDEADRMLDEGFGPEIEKLMNSTGMPSKTERNTLVFSATYSPAVLELCERFQKEVI